MSSVTDGYPVHAEQWAEFDVGYKLRKHIAGALQQRSQAIRNALDRYNAAAAALRPPAPKLSWDKVVEYAFLADFDILRDSRQDVRERPWAQPANRMLMDRYFKLERAREEIERLNIEIKRVLTHIQDEENYLLAIEEETHKTDPVLAFHISNYRLERTRYSDLHLRRFNKLTRLKGFTGDLLPGESIDPTLREGAKSLRCDSSMSVDHRQPTGEVWKDESESDPPTADEVRASSVSMEATVEEGREALQPLDEEEQDYVLLETQFQIFSIASDYRDPVPAPGYV